MLTFLDNLMSLIAPHECLACGHEGGLFCSTCIELLPSEQPGCYRCGKFDRSSKTCSNCRRQSSLEHVYIRTSYELFGRELVRKLKFERGLAAANAAAQAMYQQFGDEFSEGPVFVPIPTASSRVRRRGYDQSVLIARQLAKLTGGSCIPALERLGQHRQTGSSRAERLTQLKDAFHARPKQLQGVSEAILVDEVLTTGATLETAADTLRQAGVTHISAVVFAKSEKD